MKLVIAAILFVCASWAAGKPTYVGPTPVFPPPFITVVKESRKEPTASGEHSSFFETSNGIVVRQDGSNSDDEGAIVRGEFRYIQEDGSTASFTYIADKRGYQPQSDLLPVGPAIPAHSLLQIERARAARKDGIDSGIESSYLPPKPQDNGSDESDEALTSENQNGNKATTPKPYTQKPLPLHTTTSTKRIYTRPSRTTTRRPYIQKTTTQRRSYLYSSTTTQKPTTTTPQPDLSSEEETSYVTQIPEEKSAEVELTYLLPSEPNKLITTTATPQSEEVSAEILNNLPLLTTKASISITTETPESNEQSDEVSASYLPPSTTAVPTTTTTITSTTTTEAPESDKQSDEVSAIYLPPSTTDEPATSTSAITTTTTATKALESEELVEVEVSYSPPPATQAPAAAEESESKEESIEVSLSYIPPPTAVEPVSEEKSVEVGLADLPPPTTVELVPEEESVEVDLSDVPTSTTIEPESEGETAEAGLTYQPPPTVEPESEEETAEVLTNLPSAGTIEPESKEEVVGEDLLNIPLITSLESESGEKSEEVILTYLPPSTTQEPTTITTTTTATEAQDSDEKSAELSLFYSPPSTSNFDAESNTTTEASESEDDSEVLNSYITPLTTQDSAKEIETTTEVQDSEEETVEDGSFYSPPSVTQDVTPSSLSESDEVSVEITSSYLPPHTTQKISTVSTSTTDGVVLESEDESDEIDTYSVPEQPSTSTTETTTSTTRRSYPLLGKTYFSPTTNFKTRSNATTPRPSRYTPSNRSFTKRPYLFYKAPRKIQIPQLPPITYNVLPSEPSEESTPEEQKTEDTSADAVIDQDNLDVTINDSKILNEQITENVLLLVSSNDSTVDVGLQDDVDQSEAHVSDIDSPDESAIDAIIESSTDSSVIDVISEISSLNEETETKSIDQNSVSSTDEEEVSAINTVSQGEADTESVDTGILAEIVEVPTEVTPVTEPVNSSSATPVEQPLQAFPSDNSAGISLSEANAAVELVNLKHSPSVVDASSGVVPVDSSKSDTPVDVVLEADQQSVGEGSTSMSENTNQVQVTANAKTFHVLPAEGVSSLEAIDLFSDEIIPKESSAVLQQNLQADEEPANVTTETEIIKSDNQDQSFGTLEEVFQSIGGTVETALTDETPNTSKIELINVPEPKLFTVVRSSEDETDNSFSSTPDLIESLKTIEQPISEIRLVENRLDALDDILSAELDNSVEIFSSGVSAPQPSLSLSDALRNSGDAVVSFIKLNSRESIETFTKSPSVEFISSEDVTSVEERTDSFVKSFELNKSPEVAELSSVESRSLENNVPDVPETISELGLPPSAPSVEDSPESSLDDILDSIEIET